MMESGDVDQSWGAQRVVSCGSVERPLVLPGNGVQGASSADMGGVCPR